MCGGKVLRGQMLVKWFGTRCEVSRSGELIADGEWPTAPRPCDRDPRRYGLVAAAVASMERFCDEDLAVRSQGGDGPAGAVVLEAGADSSVIR